MSSGEVGERVVRFTKQAGSSISHGHRMSAALYFPFINVPHSRWTCRTLLYWDVVHTIMPLEYASGSKKLGKLTSELVKAELLVPIVPEQYVPEFDSLAEGFVEHIKEMDTAMVQRRRESKSRYDIHTGKLPDSQFISFLQKEKLADEFHYPWLPVESQTASEYMAYLTACISLVHDDHPRAVTDDATNCNPLLSPRDHTDSQLEGLRQNLLQTALPAPKRKLDLSELYSFKKKHGSLLPEFRFWIEQQVVSIADSTTPEIRQKRTDDTNEEMARQKKAIAKTLNKDGFAKLVFGDFFSVLGAVPGIKTLPNLVNKIYKATAVTPKTGPMAYAAFAQKELDMD